MTVFQEVKSMLPVSGDGYDQEILMQIKAAALDLTETADISMPGEISISMDPTTGAITDSSTVTDEYIITAIATWCAARIGNPPNIDQLNAAYSMIKGNMARSSRYSFGTEEI